MYARCCVVCGELCVVYCVRMVAVDDWCVMDDELCVIRCSW